MALAVAPRLGRVERLSGDDDGMVDTPPLMDYIPALTPLFSRPEHLRPLVDLLEASEHTPVRRVVSLPPQHGKTSTVLAGLAWLLRRDQARTHAYATYSATQARSKAHLFRTFVRAAGVTPSDLANLDEWRTAQGGGLLATSVEGPLTGQAVDGVLVIDDPIKDRREAESALTRQQVWDWWQSVARTRLHPAASALVVMTRWHPDDLAGRLIDDGWESLVLPALDDDGAALWPEKFPVEFLHQTRRDVGEYTWASLYQGRPRPRGGAVFRDAHYYDELPSEGYREGIGADFAYTAKTHADYSVGILGRAIGRPDSVDWRIYVTDVIRHQVQAPSFAAALKEVGGGRRVRMTAFVSGTERGTVDFLAAPPHSLPIRAETASGDKFARAQPVAAMWNDGRVLLPRAAPWLDVFIAEVCGFTGVSDAHDDQVDALAGLHHRLSQVNTWTSY